MTVQVLPWSAYDAARVLAQLRRDDQAELTAAGVSAAQFLAAVSDGWIAADESGPVCAWGVQALPGGVGVPWMVATPAIARHARALMVMAPAAIAAMRERFGVLQNVVHASNKSAMRLIERLGFTVHRQAIGPGGAFYLFDMRGSNV